MTSNRRSRFKSKPGFDKTQIECRNCGGRGHKASDENCAARGKKCYNCEKMNHFASKCFKRKRTNDSNAAKDEPDEKRKRDNVQSVTSHFDGDYIFHMNDAVANEDNNEVIVVMGGIKTKAVIDSGSKWNIIDANSWNWLKSQKVIVQNMRFGSDRILYAYGKRKMDIIGMVDLKLIVGGIESVCKFYVMNEKGSILIGSVTAKMLKLLTINIPTDQIRAVEDVGKPTKPMPLGKIRDVMIKLPIDETVRPVQQPYRRVAVPLEQAVRSHIKEMLDQDIIERVEGTSEWVSPMVVVPRSNGSVRVCIDMRQANMAIKRTPYGMPTFEELMPHVGKGKFFSRLDLKQAFHQCELHQDCRYITTFITKTGLYRYKRLMFGVVCAPEEFQKQMEMILLKCEGKLSLLKILDFFFIIIQKKKILVGIVQVHTISLTM